MEVINLQYWDVIREGSEVWVTYEVCSGYVYDPLVSCLVNNPKELNGLCASVASKNWGSQAMADELREIVDGLHEGVTVFQKSQTTDFIQPPGCAAWPLDEVRPTVVEVGNPLLDFSDFDNIRKLARAIAAQSDMEQAAMLSGELSYAYQNATYDCASVRESIQGQEVADYEEILNALAGIDEGSNFVAHILVHALKDAMTREMESEEAAA